MLKKTVVFLKKILRWLYHNLFLRLWLIFGGIIGISTTATCPCCGQAASSCPTGISIIVLLGGILAGLGVFYKKIGSSFGKIFKKNAAETPRASKCPRKWPFGWVLSFLAVGAIIEFWNYSSINAAPKNMWQPVKRTAKMCPLGAQVSGGSTSPVLKASEKSILSAQGSSDIIPESNPVESLTKSGRMHAVINADGSVEMRKEDLDVVRYETAGFLELNDDVYDRLDFYEGKKAEITGYVYRRSDFQPDQFVVARGYIRCCLSCGAVPVGPLCEWNHASELANDTWVRVKGIITREHFKDAYYEETGDIPIIKIEKIERVPKLENPYVYSRNPGIPPRSSHKSA